MAVASAFHEIPTAMLAKMIRYLVRNGKRKEDSRIDVCGLDQRFMRCEAMIALFEIRKSSVPARLVIV